MNSYGDGAKGLEVFRDAFLDVLDGAGVGINNLHIEYLDLERNKYNRNYRSQLHRLLLEKYAQQDIGVVITVQQPARDFLFHELPQLAPDAPIITVQAPAPTLSELQGRRVVSQLTHFDVRGTLERALEIFPRTRRILFVSGSSNADKAQETEAVGIGRGWRPALEFLATSEMSLENMLQTVARQPPDTVIVFIQYNRDIAGQVTRSSEVEKKVIDTANAPVFGLFDFNLVNGGIGGSVVSVKALGVNAARIAIDLSRGNRVLESPVTLENVKAIPTFNWTELTRWGGTTGRLPDDSIFLNHPTTFRQDWEDHKREISLAAFVVLLLISAITILLFNRRKRMAVEKLLLESEDRYRTKLDLALENKRQYEEGLELLLQLNQQASSMTEKQICDLAIDIAVRTTRSSIGYLHLVNEDQNTISLVTWNAQALQNCTARSDGHYPLEAAGIWADCARLGKPVIHNDYQNMAGKKSCPDGHAHLSRHMSVPVIENGKIRMIIGVGNKDSDYIAEDTQQLQLLANEVQKIVMKRRVEDALRESEARFRFMTDLSPALVWVADTDKSRTWFNKTWLDFTGRSMAQEQGRGWIESVHADDVQPCLECYTRSIDLRQAFRMEYRVRRRDGKYRWMFDVGQPRFDDQGVFQGYVGSCLDITDQRKAEEQLRKLWLAVEQSPDSIVITDLDGRIEYVNDAFGKISGYDYSEVLGQNPRLLQSGMTPATTYAEMWATLTQGDNWNGELINKRKNGELYTEFARMAPIRQPDGKITNYLAIKHDITERKRAEDAIRESRALLQCVIDSTPDWIHVKDGNHRFMLVNQSVAKAFRQTPDGMVGRPDTDFFAPEVRDGDPARRIADPANDDEIILAGEHRHYPATRITTADGEEHVFDTLRLPLRDPSQRVYGVLTYSRDITDRVRNEHEQLALEKQLQQAQKMELIGHLTGGIAHDFNNILAAMFGYAELAQMSPALEQHPQLRLCIEEILQAGIRAKELVAQLLTFSHKKETVKASIVVAPIIHEVTKLLRSTVPATISIRSAIAKNPPEALISAVHLHQILMNLGVNARDAIGGTGHIEIHAGRQVLDQRTTCSSCHAQFSGSYLLISVKDTGAGIPADNLAKIFDPFFTTKEVGRGSGLGLSVLHGIVHSANGHIEVVTAPGSGTEFRIYLPEHLPERPQERASAPADSQAMRLHGHVLIVDDESSIVGFMTRLLENLGCKVTGMTSATEALQFFLNAPDDFDMVITDQTMPNLTGAELARAILARRPELPVVLSTGYSNAMDDSVARQIGLRRLLMNPVPARVLSDVVAECLAGNAARI